jgi:hypothetical protein
MEANTTHTDGISDRLVDQPHRSWRRLIEGFAGRGWWRMRARDSAAPLDEAGKRLGHYLRGSQAMILHRRRLPGERSRINQIVVGPAGVTVIDSRHYKAGRVDLQDGRIRVGLRNRSDLLDAVIAQVEGVRRVLTDTPYEQVTVEAAIARRKVNGAPVLEAPNASRVVVCGTRRIAGEASRPGSLSDRKVKALAAYLDGALAR